MIKKIILINFDRYIATPLNQL